MRPIPPILHQQIGQKISGVFRAGRPYMVFCVVIRPYEVAPEGEGPNIKPYEAIPEMGPHIKPYEAAL